MRFTSIRCALALCALCLGSKRPVRLSAPLAFTNIVFDSLPFPSFFLTFFLNSLLLIFSNPLSVPLAKFSAFSFYLFPNGLNLMSNQIRLFLPTSYPVSFPNLPLLIPPPPQVTQPCNPKASKAFIHQLTS